MLVANLDNRRIMASLAKKSNLHSCPKCSRKVILKQGRKVVHHFAHEPRTDCLWGTGETLAHLNAKKLLLDAFVSRGLRAEVEVDIETLPSDSDRRADVFVWAPDGRKVAIELQHSSIDLDQLERRVGAYARADIAQLWIPFMRKNIIEENGERCIPREFEKWIHGFYFSNMWMYYPEDENFWKVKITSCEIHVPETSWYDSYGELEYGGGYTKYAKRMRNLELEGPFTIDQLKIRISYRKSWRSNKPPYYNFPNADLATFVEKV